MDQENPSSSLPITIRPMVDGDFNFVVMTWLKANQWSPDAIAMGVNRDKSALQRYWTGCERLVQRLVEKTSVTVAEAEMDGSKVIAGYVCHEDDAVIHYLLSRRKMQNFGIAKSLMQPFMDVAPGEVIYTFRPAVRGLKVPDHFRYDPYRALLWLK